VAACALLVGAVLAGCHQRPVEAPKAADTGSRIVIESSDKARKAARTARQALPSKRDVRLVQGATAAEVGVAFYPGATVVSSQFVREGADITAGAELTTKDPYQEVVDFYRNRYGSPELKVVQQDLPTGKMTLLNWRDPEGNYTVGLRRDDDAKQTTITLAKVRSGRKPRTGR
jgi:hypothetical protein